MKQLRQVNEFMKVMGQDMPEKPTIPDAKVYSLREELITEENKELTTAWIASDIVGAADALCDLLYVTLGAFTAYGFSPELVEELFDEVQRSNMSKVCKTELEAIETSLMYADEGIPAHRSEVEGKWVVSRLPDHKVLKSVNWSPPDLRTILERHGVL